LLAYTELKRFGIASHLQCSSSGCLALFCFSSTCRSRIVEKNPKKFKIDASEVAERQQFIKRAKAFVKVCYLFINFIIRFKFLQHFLCVFVA